MLTNHEKLQLDLLLKDSYIEIVEKTVNTLELITPLNLKKVGM